MDSNHQDSAYYLLHLVAWQLLAELHHCLVFLIHLHLQLMLLKFSIQRDISCWSKVTNSCTATCETKALTTIAFSIDAIIRKSYHRLLLFERSVRHTTESSLTFLVTDINSAIYFSWRQDWVLSHWAHFTLRRFFCVYVFFCVVLSYCICVVLL